MRFFFQLRVFRVVLLFGDVLLLLAKGEGGYMKIGNSRLRRHIISVIQKHRTRERSKKTPALL